MTPPDVSDLSDLITITESVDGDEVAMLTFTLDRVRAQFAWKAEGLTADQLHQTHPPSVMTIGGLLKHLALVEDTNVAKHLTGGSPGKPWEDVDWAADSEWEWHTALDDPPEVLYPLWREAVRRSREAWGTALAHGLDQPSKVTEWLGARPTLRRAYVDLIEEYLKHCGHADLLREAIDGRVGNDPPQPLVG